MNTRRTITVICVIAMVAYALIAGRSSRSVGIRSGPELTLSSGNQGPATSTGLVTNSPSTQTANADLSKGPGSNVPDYVVYGQLFRAVVLIKQQTESDERTGKSGADSATQSLLNLSEAEAIELEQTASTWDQEKEPIISQAEEIITHYRDQRSTAIADGKELPDAPYGELEQLQEKLNGTILDARDRLRERLEEKVFDHFQQAVEEHVTANIKMKSLDLKNPDLQESDSPQTARTTLMTTSKDALGGMRIDRTRMNKENQGTRKDAGRSDIRQKSGNPVKDTRKNLKAAGAQGQEPAFNFCFFGGIVFYGTFLWLAPQLDTVFQLSFTQLDICAGLVYDPYVYGALYYTFNYYFAEDHESFGRSFFRPAIVINHAFAFPSTLYSAYAEHWILQCGPFRPNSPAPNCNWYLVDYYWVQGFTPQCVSGGVPLGESPNFNTCAGPSPTPTPTPTIKIDSVGFTGDYMIRHWDKDVPDRVRYDDPDGSEPSWRRSSKDKRFPAAYKRGTNPTMFATFTMNPAPSTSRPVQIRVKKGATVIATKSDNIGGGQATIRDIQVDFNGLESAALVKRGEYEFIWEMSFDNGTNWANAGKSGKHTIYWTWDAPLPQTFKNYQNTECFMVSGNQIECDTLYDEALKHSAGETGSGTSDLNTTIVRINAGVDNDIIYDPGKLDPTDHPLLILNSPFNRKAQCSGTANFFRGLLRSIGIGAVTHYWAGGDPGTGTSYLYYYINSSNKVSFRVQRAASSEGTETANVEQNPHFSFHATVEAGGDFYDPSYGLTSSQAGVELLEASKYPDSGFYEGTTESNPRRLESLNFITNQYLTGTTCPHGQTAGNLFPNPIDDAPFFVEQHYSDILNRGSDPNGFQGWLAYINQCNGEPSCVFDHRISMSMGFTFSSEFQERGYFLERFYKAAYARYPMFDEYLPGWGEIAHQVASNEDLERNKQIFADDFVASEEFEEAYPFTMEHSTYVDTLFANAGITPDPGERAALISGLENETETRATVLRRVVDNPTFFNSEFNRAFILSCYFTYLRRDPDPNGYNNWLETLNNEGDFRHITLGFIYSTEYRARFGQP